MRLGVDERIKKALKENPPMMCDQKLNEFYERMKKEGIVIKKPYAFPPLDTIGSALCQDLEHQYRQTS